MSGSRPTTRCGWINPTSAPVAAASRCPWAWRSGSSPSRPDWSATPRRTTTRSPSSAGSSAEAAEEGFKDGELGVGEFGEAGGRLADDVRGVGGGLLAGRSERHELAPAVVGVGGPLDQPPGLEVVDDERGVGCVDPGELRDVAQRERTFGQPHQDLDPAHATAQAEGLAQFLAVVVGEHESSQFLPDASDVVTVLWLTPG